MFLNSTPGITEGWWQEGNSLAQLIQLLKCRNGSARTRHAYVRSSLLRLAQEANCSLHWNDLASKWHTIGDDDELTSALRQPRV
jgi:hypothetical protein